MKIQDVVFIVVLLILFLIRKQKYFVISGLSCYILAIPLFAAWVFFTAERLTWYGSFFLLTSLLIPKGLRNTIK